MTISKNPSRVLEVTDFEIIVCPPTSTLKLKLKIYTNDTNIYIELQHMFMAFRPMYYKLLTLRFERYKRVCWFAGISTDGNREGMAILLTSKRISVN
jgi:hypothetical protein